MPTPIHYPGAIRTYYWEDKYPGSWMDTNVVGVHSTEGSSLVSYNNGAVAPNLSVNIKGRRVWEHFPLNKSSRALRNLRGGVDTNTANVCQIEFIGSCDPNSRVFPKMYDLTDDDLRFVGHVLRTIESLCPGVELVLPPQGFKPYPASAGANNGVRMSNDQWRSFKGICGHQHVPENLHGDPGNMDLGRALALTAGKGQVTQAVKTLVKGLGWARTDRPGVADYGSVGTISAGVVLAAYRADMAAPDGVVGHETAAAEPVRITLEALRRLGVVSKEYAARGILGTTAAQGYGEAMAKIGRRDTGVSVAGLAELYKAAGIRASVVA